MNAWMFVAAFLLKIAMDMLPHSFVRAAFMVPAAKTAALYWGVPLAADPLSFEAHGVALEVVRACAATDFFSIVAAMLAFRLAIESRPLRVVAALAAAWVASVAANSARLALLVAVDAYFPHELLPAVHMAAGLAVFLPVFAALWIFLSKSRKTEDRR